MKLRFILNYSHYHQKATQGKEFSSPAKKTYRFSSHFNRMKKGSPRT
jgi:hypothetical protein